jgi:hypothetical protein
MVSLQFQRTVYSGNKLFRNWTNNALSWEIQVAETTIRVYTIEILSQCLFFKTNCFLTLFLRSKTKVSNGCQLCFRLQLLNYIFLWETIFTIIFECLYCIQIFNPLLHSTGIRLSFDIFSRKSLSFTNNSWGYFLVDFNNGGVSNERYRYRKCNKN